MQKIACLIAASLCFAGQSAREVQKEVPVTKSEEAPKKETVQQKGAAKRSMERDTSFHQRKGAAKLAIESES
jgi:hypothetical protein